MPQRSTDPELSDRELLIAKKAADLAVAQMTSDFYSSVGKMVVTRFFIIIGALVVGIAYGKGWFGMIFPGKN
jgi:hypothetical protein